MEITRLSYDLVVRPSKWSPPQITAMLKTIADDINVKHPEISRRIMHGDLQRSTPFIKARHKRARLDYFEQRNGRIKVGYIVEGLF